MSVVAPWAADIATPRSASRRDTSAGFTPLNVTRVSLVSFEMRSIPTRLSRKVLLKEGEGTTPKYPGGGEAHGASGGGGDDRGERGGDRGPRR